MRQNTSVATKFDPPWDMFPTLESTLPFLGRSDEILEKINSLKTTEGCKGVRNSVKQDDPIADIKNDIEEIKTIVAERQKAQQAYNEAHKDDLPPQCASAIKELKGI